jgi:hypothetical protein
MLGFAGVTAMDVSVTPAAVVAPPPPPPPPQAASITIANKLDASKFNNDLFIFRTPLADFDPRKYRAALEAHGLWSRA